MTSAVKSSPIHPEGGQGREGGFFFRSDQPRKRRDAANSTKFNRPYDEENGERERNQGYRVETGNVKHVNRYYNHPAARRENYYGTTTTTILK
jgi:hypothetical protein